MPKGESPISQWECSSPTLPLSDPSRRVDSNAGECLHCAEAFVRLLIGMMLGKMGVLFFSCSIAPEFSRNICASYTGVCVIAFASGLFDAFIPAMISTYVIKPMNSKGESHD